MDSHSWSLNCIPSHPPQPLISARPLHGVKGPRQVPSSVDAREVKGQLGAQKALVSQVAGLPPASHTRRPAQSWGEGGSATCPHHAETKGLQARALPQHLPGAWFWRSQGCPTLTSLRYHFCISWASLCATCPQAPLQLPERLTPGSQQH